MPGATPIFGFPYPDPSDLVANYPALGQQLAEDVEDAIYARKILQIVRATDTTLNSTTSTSYVDVTGMTVTITPQFANSNLIIIADGYCQVNWTTNSDQYASIQLTDSANTALNGAQNLLYGVLNITGSGTRAFFTPFTIIGYVAAVNTSSRSYKMRFKSGQAGNTALVRNDDSTGQMYAIEVSA
jgi:hypothetical protein